MEAGKGSSANPGIKNNSDTLVIISVLPSQKTKPTLFASQSSFIYRRIYRGGHPEISQGHP